MKYFSDTTTIVIFIIFTVLMYGIVLLIRRTRKSNTREGFYVADRKVGVTSGALSVAVSWVWAPALFVASSIAYDLGLPGALWFIIPNIACFFVFAPIAIKFRTLVPQGYTLPGFFHAKYPKNRGLPIAFATTASLFALAAIVENLVAISKLYNFYTGNPGWIAIILMSLIALGYSLLSGLKASIVTDIFQMMLVVIVGLFLIPWVLNVTTGQANLSISMLYGQSGDFSWLAVAFTPGLSLLFGLIGGPLGDQMFFQRAMAVKKEKIKKTMYRAGIYFAIVPITLSVFGFLGTALKDKIEVTDSELVGAIILRQYLPETASILFFFMMMCGLASTLDSAYCAGGAIFGRDVLSRLLPQLRENKEINLSRILMIVFALVGAILAFASRDIWYVFMTDAAIASSGIVPIILTAYWKKQTGKATFWSLVLSMIAGCIISIAGHFYDANTLAALGAPISVFIGIVVSIVLSLSAKKEVV